MRPSPEDIIGAVFDAAQKAVRAVVVGSIVELGPTSLAALEEVQVNVTGRDGIASETTLAALLALLTPGTPQQFAGSVGVSPQTITFSGPTKHVVVLNPEFNSTIEISFNGGASYVRIPGRGQISIPARVTSLMVRSGGGTVDYAVVATV